MNFEWSKALAISAAKQHAVLCSPIVEPHLSNFFGFLPPLRGLYQIHLFSSGALIASRIGSSNGSLFFFCTATKNHSVQSHQSLCVTNESCSCRTAMQSPIPQPQNAHTVLKHRQRSIVIALKNCSHVTRSLRDMRHSRGFNDHFSPLNQLHAWPFHLSASDRVAEAAF